MKKITITVSDDISLDIIKALINFNITEFSVSSVGEEKPTLKIDPSAFEMLMQKEEPKKRVIHRGEITSTQEVLNLLSANNGYMEFDKIKRAVMGHGYAANTTNAALSKLKQDGKVVSENKAGGKVIWKLING